MYLLEFALISAWSWVLGEWPAMLTGSYKCSSLIQLMNLPLEVLLKHERKEWHTPNNTNIIKREKKGILTGLWSLCNYETAPRENVPNNFHTLNLGVWLYLIIPASLYYKVPAVSRVVEPQEHLHTMRCHSRPPSCHTSSSQITIAYNFTRNMLTLFCTKI